MSDKAQPTPGPWKACGTIYEHMNAEVRSGAKGEGQAIAQVWDGPNAFADARLIAAAPDGLALADAVIAAVDGACTVERDHPQAALADVLRAARALRAKATGA